MRYFEFIYDGEPKFWNIEIEGNIVSLTFGKGGVNGEPLSGQYSSSEYAKKDALRLIQRKLKEGYIELPGGDGDQPKWRLEEEVLNTVALVE